MRDKILDENGKPIHYTLKTTMTITIRSKMRIPIVADDEEGARGTTREYQKKLHQGIAYAIFSSIENDRDDSWFDETAIEKTETYIEGFPEDDLTDFAEIMLEYKHGKETWQGERIPTKAERDMTKSGTPE